MIDGPSREEIEEFVRELVRIKVIFGGTDSLQSLFAPPLNSEDRRKFTQSVRELADEGEQLALAIRRLGNENLPDSLSIDSDKNFEAALGYSGARRIVGALPREYKKVTAEAWKFMRDVNTTFELERAETYQARKAAELETANHLKFTIDIISEARDPELLAPQAQLAYFLAEKSKESWDLREQWNDMEREIYLTLLAVQIKELTRHRVRMWWDRFLLILLRFGIGLVGGVGVGVIILNALADVAPGWWLKTGISIVGGLITTALVSWVTNRFLGRAKSDHVRRLAGWYMTARMALLGQKIAAVTLSHRLTSGPDLGLGFSADEPPVDGNSL
jgi:hypothetical protein